MEKRPILPAEGYTKEELRGIWRRFRSRRSAAKILADFAMMDEYQARQLIREFRGEESEQGEIIESLPTLPQATHNEQDFMW